jgi:hypothetical protein
MKILGGPGLLNDLYLNSYSIMKFYYVTIYMAMLALIALFLP